MTTIEQTRARALACRAFWTNHPLSQIYALANGHWLGGVFVPSGEWSLRQLITFAETLPAHVIEALADEVETPCAN